MASWKSACSLGGRVRQRFVLAFMMFMAVVNMLVMRNCIAMALVKMSKPVNTNTTETYDFDWSPEIQGLIKGVFYYGYIVSHLPGGYLSDRFGGKWLLFFGVASSAVGTLLLPQTVRLGGWRALIVLRLVLGLGQGPVIPAIGALISKWVPLNERGRMGSLVLSAVQIGFCISSSISGLTLHYWMWDYTFYFYGALGTLFCVFWMFLCFSVPEDHPYITERELKYLNETVAPKKRVKPVPWKHILSSLPVWGLLIGQVGRDWAVFTMIHELPSYMKDILGFNIRENGFLSALPYLCMWLCSFATGAIADMIVQKKKMAIVNVRRTFTIIASVVPAPCLVALTLPRDRYVAVAIVSVGMTFMAFYYPGLRVNIFDITKNYAGTAVALVNGLAAVSGAISPTLKGYLTPHGTLEEWRLVYIITAVMLIVTCAVYCISAKGDRQIWDYQDDETETPPEKTNKKRVKSDYSKQGDQVKQDKTLPSTALPRPNTPPPAGSSPPENQKGWWWWPF